MRKILCVFAIMAIMTGCAAPVYETLGDVIHVGGRGVQPRESILSFPEEASLLTSSGDDRLYLCDGYTLTLQTHTDGDFAATVMELSGRDLSDLTVLESVCGDHKRSDLVWVTNGEDGQIVCRAAVLDDGNYHYSLTVMAKAADAADLTETWNSLFSSFCLETEKTT